MRKFLLALIVGVIPFAQASAEELRLGFISILSGQLALLGQEQKRGFDLALEALGGKVGGIDTKVFVADNKGNPGDAVQEATKLIDRDKIDVVTGLAASHTTMAALKPLLAANVIALGANAGPSPLAGKGCNKNWFSTGFHNDQWDMAAGQYMTQKGLKRVYFMGMDYQAGWDHVKAAIREFKGEKVAEVYTPIAQMDFSAELTQLRAAKPDAVFVFYVGPNAVAFLKQYTQAGLAKTIPLYSMGAIADPLLYKAEGDAALGLVTTEAWNTELDNAANKKFVADFNKKFGRDPTGYAARQYDAVMLLDAAIRQIKGKVSDKDALRSALRKADFHSVRGDFRFNSNQYPILNVYVQEVSKRPDGTMYQKLTGTVIKDIKDPDYVNCKM
ncbi:MAG: ABC transporter substrate-binding protein [Candidatus Eiseniibacteriota bacterium]